MGAKLEALRVLQDIELQIVDIRRQLAAKQNGAQRQANRLKEAEQALAAAREDLKHTQVELDALDVEIKGRNAHVSRLRDNLNSVKTNKEYAAVLSQLNNEKADATRLEARLFQLYETVEAKKKGIAEQQAAVEAEAARLQNLRGQLDQAQNSFKQRMELLERQRAAAAAKLPPKELELFERVSERYDGEVMARVVRTHPRRDEFMCDGCNVALAVERANALLSRDDIITCDNCGRVLYIERS